MEAEALEHLRRIFLALDYVGVFIFAVTGALVAARARQDFVTCAFFAGMTGMGGGTVRDLLIGAPVFLDQSWLVRRRLPAGDGRRMVPAHRSMAGQAAALAGWRGAFRLLRLRLAEGAQLWRRSGARRADGGDHRHLRRRFA